MNAKQKHVKHQIFALLRESELTDDQLDDLVFEWKIGISKEKARLNQNKIHARKEHAFV